MKRLLIIFAALALLGQPASAASTYTLMMLNSATVPLSATTSGANVALPAAGHGVMVTNLGAFPAWCSSGIGSGTAALASTGAGILVAPGAIITAQIEFTDTYIACITTGGTSLMSVSVVEGQ